MTNNLKARSYDDLADDLFATTLEGLGHMTATWCKDNLIMMRKLREKAAQMRAGKN